MTRSKLAVGACLLAVFAIPVFFVLGDGDDRTKNGDNTDLRKKDEDRPPRKSGSVKQPLFRCLDKTVRLEFQLHPKEEDAPPLLVLCAVRNYSIDRIIDGPDFSRTIKIAGELQPIDVEDGILFTYEAHLQHIDYNDDFEANFKTKGSAVLRFGKGRTLGYLGDHALKVTATAD